MDFRNYISIQSIIFKENLLQEYLKTLLKRITTKDEVVFLQKKISSYGME